MSRDKKRQLLEEFKNRKVEKGIISYLCKETGDSFIGISSDTKADFNSNSFKLSLNNHRNKRLQELWNKYGKDGFEIKTLKVIKQNDPNEDDTKKLEELCEKCLEEDVSARRI